MIGDDMMDVSFPAVDGAVSYTAYSVAGLRPPYTVAPLFTAGSDGEDTPENSPVPHYTYTVTGPGQPDTEVTIEPAGDPLTIDVFSDGTWLVNGEEWTGDE